MTIALFRPFEEARKEMLRDRIEMAPVTGTELLRLHSKAQDAYLGRLHRSHFTGVHDIEETLIDVATLEQLATAKEYAIKAVRLFQFIAAMYWDKNTTPTSIIESVFLDRYRKTHERGTLAEAFGIYCVEHNNLTAFEQFNIRRESFLREVIGVTPNRNPCLVDIHKLTERPRYLGIIPASVYEAMNALFPEDRITIQTLQQYCLSEHAATAVPFFKALAALYCCRYPPFLRPVDRELIEVYRDVHDLSSQEEAFAHYCVECITPEEE